MGFILPLLVGIPSAATGMIAGALMFAVIVTALFFMVAYFFQSPQLTAMAHEEMAALIFTAMIIVFWVSTDAFLNGITNGLVGVVMPSHLDSIPSGDLATNHLELAIAANDVFLSKMKTLYFNLYLYEVLIGFLSTISFPILTIPSGPTIISFSFMPYISLGMLSSAYTTVVESIGLIAGMLWIKEFLLYFCMDITPLILLPIGIFLRAFPLSRTTGSSIISVCFALFFVFPFAVLLSNYLVFDLYQPSEAPPVPSAITLFKTVLSPEEGKERIDELREGKDEEADQSRQELFYGEPIAQRAATGSGSACDGWELLCSAEKIGKATYTFAKEFVIAIKNIWMFMMGFMGDFHQGVIDNPLLPTNVASGLYDFIIRAVIHVAQFIVMVILTSILEIIITITMYRNISWIIGGEMELAGITKIV